VFIGEILIDGEGFSVRGKSGNEFDEDKRFLAFGSREI
jgi:hypothetical protein